MLGVSGVTVVTTLVCSFYFACEAAGASCARHSLRPLISEGRTSMQNSGAGRGEIAKSCLDVIARGKATKQSSFLFLGAMDCFAEPVIGRAFARPVGSQ